MLKRKQAAAAYGITVITGSSLRSVQDPAPVRSGPRRVLLTSPETRALRSHTTTHMLLLVFPQYGYSALPPNHSTRPPPFLTGHGFTCTPGHESESSGSGGGWPTATTAGCSPPLASKEAWRGTPVPADLSSAGFRVRRVDSGPRVPRPSLGHACDAIAHRSQHSAVCFHVLSRLGEQIQTDWTGSGVHPSSSALQVQVQGLELSKQFPSTSWTSMLASSHGSGSRSRGRIPGNSSRQAQNIINCESRHQSTPLAICMCSDKRTPALFAKVRTCTSMLG